MPKNQTKIQVTKNGPYTLTGKVPLSEQIIIPNKEGDPHQWRKGKEYKTSDKCDLCRCGQSKHKPYCDKTHIQTNFNGTETAHPEPYLKHPKTIEGPEITLTDIEDLCASARFCHRKGGIWNLTPKTNNPKSRDLVIQESRDCPSGRLTVRDKKTNKAFEPNLEQSIGFIEDPQMGVSGPIWVRGCISIESADGKPYTIRNRVTLCRCGKSENKPFCDSSHYPEEHKHNENQK
jgi:CDGSH-type Zn-finger protein